MVNDKETRSELNGLGNFVERNLSGRKLSDDEESILKEAKDRFGRVRERLLCKFSSQALSLAAFFRWWLNEHFCFMSYGSFTAHYNSRINRVLEELQYLRDTFSENQAGQVRKLLIVCSWSSLPHASCSFFSWLFRSLRKTWIPWPGLFFMMNKVNQRLRWNWSKILRCSSQLSFVRYETATVIILRVVPILLLTTALICLPPNRSNLCQCLELL